MHFDLNAECSPPYSLQSDGTVVKDFPLYDLWVEGGVQLDFHFVNHFTVTVTHSLT